MLLAAFRMFDMSDMKTISNRREKSLRGRGAIVRTAMTGGSPIRRAGAAEAVREAGTRLAT